MTAVPQDLLARSPGERALHAANPFEVFACCWRHRALVGLLARRDVLARYRGSLLGLVWSFVNPLLLLAAFSFVFGTVLQARWRVPVPNQAQFALILFAGLIVFWLLADCLGRAPALLLQHAGYIKRVVFPLEILPWVALLSALFHTLASTLVFFGFHAAINGVPPWTALLLPLVLAPIALLALGLLWFLSSAGLFVRDLAQVVPVVIMLLMFLSPLFYPIEAVPAPMREVLQVNPLAFVIGQARGVLLWGRPPDWGALAAATGASWLVAWLGLVWFVRTRKGFADVV